MTTKCLDFNEDCSLKLDIQSNLNFNKTNALSFYRSQNVLYQSKFFESAQKFDCI